MQQTSPAGENNRKPIAIVLAKGINGLGVVRSLFAAGFASIVITSRRRDLAALSRIPVRKLLVPQSPSWQQDLLRLLASLAPEGKPPILACYDLAATFLAEHQAELRQHYSLLLPDPSITTALNDKRRELELMMENGIVIPRSFTHLERLHLENDLDALTYPLLIKPRTQEDTKIIGAKNILVPDKATLHEFCIRYQDSLDRFIMQEAIPGGDSALWLCSAAFDARSELIAAFTYQRLGAMPASFGVTSIGISVPSQQIKDLVAAVGAKLGYVGPVDMEFMHDIRSNQFLYIETNPRIGMCNWFDTRCGVNIVAAYCNSALGVDNNAAFRQETDVIFWNLLGDLTARIEARQRPADILRLYRTLFRRKMVWMIYLHSDPYPTLASLASGAAALALRGIRMLGRSSGLLTAQMACLAPSWPI